MREEWAKNHVYLCVLYLITSLPLVRQLKCQLAIPSLDLCMYKYIQPRKRMVLSCLILVLDLVIGENTIISGSPGRGSTTLNRIDTDHIQSLSNCNPNDRDFTQVTGLSGSWPTSA